LENDILAFKKSYFDESWYSVSLDEGALTLSDRKLSTYVNALAKDSDFAKKAKMLSVTFVVKARKL